MGGLALKKPEFDVYSDWPDFSKAAEKGKLVGLKAVMSTLAKMKAES